MGSPNATDEHLRLKKLYGKMYDGELIHIAHDMASLTDVARGALQAEIQQRNLSLQPVHEPTPVVSEAPATEEIPEHETDSATVAHFVGISSVGTEKTGLEKVYSHMHDSELIQIAGEMYSLTDVAREALRAELQRRGLDLPAVHKPVSKKMLRF